MFGKLAGIFKGGKAQHPEDKKHSDEANHAQSAPVTNGIELKREAELEALLEETIIDLEELKKITWFGLKPQTRGKVWKILLEYYPVNRDMWEESISRKRAEYLDLATGHFQDLTYSEDKEEQEGITERMSPYEEENYKQIVIDVKRTRPCEAYAHHTVKNMLSRALFIWAFKHPASGYV
jgi:hypothetical protein